MIKKRNAKQVLTRLVETVVDKKLKLNEASENEPNYNVVAKLLRREHEIWLKEIPKGTSIKKAQELVPELKTIEDKLDKMNVISKDGTVNPDLSYFDKLERLISSFN